MSWKKIVGANEKEIADVGARIHTDGDVARVQPAEWLEETECCEGRV